MILMESILKIIDNSGGKLARCIKVCGGSKKFTAFIGDLVIVSIRKAIPHSKVKKGEIYKAILVRSKHGIRRKNGIIIKFPDNCIILMNRETLSPIGSKISCSVPIEIKASKFANAVSICKEFL